MTTHSMTLWPTITVHCFACPFVVGAADPQSAHVLMEAHYAEKHAALITRLAEGSDD